MLCRKIAAFVVRDFLWDLSYPLNFFWRAGSIIFNLITFYFLGFLVAGATAGYLSHYGDGRYFPFVLVGLALTGFQNVALTSISFAIQYGMYTGTLEAMLVTPTSLSTIVFASVLYQFVSALLSIVLYMVFGAMLFDFSLVQANFGAAAVMLFLTLLAHLPLGIFSASFLLIFKRGDPITSLLGHLSALLAGVYFPLTVLPGWLQTLAFFLPFTHALEGLRQAMLNGRGLLELIFQVTVLGLFAAILLPLSLWVFSSAIHQAKRLGTLSQF
ncbi:MAG: ABC transporter permease [Desulfobaccales bacterium]